MITPKISNILVVLILTVLSLAILANSAIKPIGRDEQMYCAAGSLMAQGKMIYRDFSYVAQLPYHPLLYAALFRIFNTTHYLLVGRILSCLGDILVAVCIVGIYRYIFASFPISGMLLGIAGAVLYVFNPLVDYANGYAWNHDLVVLLVLLSFWLFVSVDFKRKSKYWRIAAIGALLTLASCMRITTALVQLLFFAVLLSRTAGSIKKRLKTILPFLITAASVLIWPVWVIVQARRAFFLNLFWIPVLCGRWLHRIGMVHNKLNLIFASLTTPGYLVLIVLTIYLCLAIVWHRHKISISNKKNALLAALLPITFFIIALIPPTMWRQYLAIPVPFIIVSAAFPLLYLRKLTDRTSLDKHFNIAAVLVAVCVFMVVASYPVVLRRIPKLFTPQNWVPIRLHNISEEIAQETGEPKLILTLAPLYALEGGCNIYTELSCGSIVYRVADYLSAWNQDITHTAGPGTLKELLEKSPPSAVVLGVEMQFLEESLFESAVQPDAEKWERKTYEDGPIVYFRR